MAADATDAATPVPLPAPEQKKEEGLRQNGYGTCTASVLSTETQPAIENRERSVGTLGT
jgi:hypothetical protein